MDFFYQLCPLTILVSLFAITYSWHSRIEKQNEETKKTLLEMKAMLSKLMKDQHR